MKFFRTHKKIVLSISIAAIVFLASTMLYYFYSTNIINTIEIKVTSTDINLLNQVNVKAIGPLGRSFDIKYCKESKSWNTKDFYLNSVEIIVPEYIAKNDSISITINNKLIETYKSGINTSIIGNNKRITIDQIFPISFSEKFVYFIAFYFNRLIGLKIHFKKYLSLIIYLTMLTIVFLKVIRIQKKIKGSKDLTNNEN